MSSLCPLSCFQSFSYPLWWREGMCWTFCSWIYFLKVLALASIRCLNSCFFLLTAVIKRLDRGVDCASEGWLWQRGAAASSLLPGRVTFPSQAGRGSRCGAAPLRWHRVTAGRAAPCQLPSDSQRPGGPGRMGHLAHCCPIFPAARSPCSQLPVLRVSPGQSASHRGVSPASLAVCEPLSGDMCPRAGHVSQVCLQGWQG